MSAMTRGVASDGSHAKSDGSGTYHVQALTRGMQILELLAGSRTPLTLVGLHSASKLPKSTLVRLLSALAEQQFIVRVDDRPAYRLGHKVLDLGMAYVASLDVSETARPYLTQLAADTGHTSNLGVLDGPQVLHVAVETATRPLRFESRAGERAQTYCTGLGKMLLAGLPESELAAHLPARLTKLTPNTLTSRAALSAALAEIRTRGYASDDNEHSVGLRCLAVPVTIDGEVIAALSVSGASGEFEASAQKGYLRHLRETARLLADDPEVVHALREVPKSTAAPAPGH